MTQKAKHFTTPPAPFFLEKAIEAASILLSEFKAHNMEYTRLLKLLYIIDRRVIKKTGIPMIGPRWVAMKKGPLHSHIYDMIKHEDSRAATWQEFFDTRDNTIYRKKDPGVASLSRAEVRIIRESGEEYRLFDTWDLVEETHKFKEWETTFKSLGDPKSSAPITPQSLYEALGMGEEFETYLDQVNELRAMQQAGASS